MRTLAPILSPSYQPHSAPATVRGSLEKSYRQRRSISCGPRNLARPASYPSPPMSGSPSPPQRSTDLEDPQRPANYQPTLRDSEQNQPPVSNPELYIQPVPPDATRYYRPFPAQQAWSVGLAQQTAHPLTTANPPYFNPTTTVPRSSDSFLRNPLSTPLEGPTHIINTPTSLPPRPARKAKNHVPSACINCKRAHLACETERPCGRCVASGKEDTCQDVPHKKRGRPRLKSDQSFSGDPNRPLHSQAQVLPRPEDYASGRLDPLRSSRPRGNISPTYSRRPHSEMGISQASSRTSDFRSPREILQRPSPVAFLNEDLVIIRPNQAFLDVVPMTTDSQDLHNYVFASSHESLRRVREELREERMARDPAYLPPMIRPGDSDSIPAVEDVDIESVTRSYSERSITLHFLRPSGIASEQQVRFRLARTSTVFFAIIDFMPVSISTGDAYFASSSRHRPLAPTPSFLAPSSSFALPHYHQSWSQGLTGYASAPHSPYHSVVPSSSTLPALTPPAYTATSSSGYSPRYEMPFVPPPPPSQDPSYSYGQQSNPYFPSSEYRPYTQSAYQPPSLPPMRTEAHDPAYPVSTGSSSRPPTRQREETPPEDQAEQTQEEFRHKRRRTEMDISKILERRG